MNRRRAFSYIAGLLASIPVFAQKQGVMEKGQAVVCDSGSTKCPLGHATCISINAPLVVGNGNRDYPDVAQLFDQRIHKCDQCGILFIPV